MRPGGRWSVTETPLIRPAGGTFRWPVTVGLACAAPGSSVAYTTESGPGARWRLYNGEFVLDKSARLRAVACRLGYRDSAEAVAEFRIETA
jgi:hypothetical protein